MPLRHRTELLRRTLLEDAQVILGPNKLDQGDRRVQVIIPSGGKVYLAVGPMPATPREDGLEGIDNAGAMPEDIAYERVYQWPPVEAGQTVEIDLQANQWLSAAVAEGNLTLALLVTYPGEG